MESTKAFDIVLFLTGLGLVLAGFWMFKDMMIENAEMSKIIFQKYKYDFVAGALLILLGSVFVMLIENKRLHKFIEGINSKK